MLSMLSSFTGLFNTFGALPHILGKLILVIIFWPFTLIYIAVMAVAYFAEIVFKKLAGIDPIILNGQQLTGASGDGKDLVYGFITDPAIQNVFWSIVALSIVLLFICTLVALIKSEFTLDLKGSAKGPILGRAVKSLVNFITVPVVTIIAILGTNFLTKSIYDMFGGEDSTIITKCFYIGAYNANRARIDADFATTLSTGEYAYLDSSNNQVFSSGNNPFAGKSQAEVANIIDSHFMNGESISGLKYNNINWFSALWDGYLDEYVDTGNPEGDGILAVTKAFKKVNWSLVVFDYPDENFSIINATSLNFYYDLTKFDYMLAVGSGVVMAWLLLSVGVVLLKRVFELTILFLLAPAMTAIAPLDGGQSEKKWRGEFMKRLLAVIGPIFAYNMYFLMVPLFENISLFSGLSEGWGYITGAVGSVSATVGASSMLGSIVSMFSTYFNVFDVFFQLVCIFVGLSIVKSASALLSALLGIDDLVKSGAENTKKAIDLGKKAALGATAITGMAVRGAAVAVKSGRAAFKGLKNKGSTGAKSAKQAKEELKGSEDEHEQMSKAVDEEDDNINELQHSIQKTDAYKANEAVITDLQERKAEGVVFSEEENDRLKKALAKRKLFNGENISDAAEATSAMDELKAGGADIDTINKLKSARASRDAKEKARVAKANEIDLLKKGVSKNQQADFFDDEGKIKDEKKLSDAQKEFLKQASAGGVISHVKGAINEEFGKDSQKTSAMGTLMNSSKYKSISKKLSKVAPTAITAMEQWLNPDNSESNTIKRRLNDALAGMFGEGGGGELWKIWFNKNARANLYEGVPESKKRTSNIEQSLSWGARDKWQKDEDAKKARAEQEKLIKRMLAYQKGGDFAAEYERLRQQRENETNEAQIKNLDAKIEKMEISSGITQQARDFYDQATPGSAKAKQLAEFKEMISDKAAKDAAISERKTKEKAMKATIATADKPLDVKFSDASMNKLIEAMNKARKGEDSSMKELMESIKEMNGATEMKSVAEALQKLIEIMEKKS